MFGKNNMKKVLLLVNAIAGNSYGKRNTYNMIERFAIEGYETTVFPIIPKNGAESLYIRSLINGDYDVVACCGGDGTLHYVINVLLKSGEKKPILYIPAGTTNDYAKTLGIPFSYNQTISLLKSGDLLSVDIGLFNESYFDYVAAFGAFTDVSYSTDQNIKNILGYSAYLLQSLGTATDALNMKIHMSIKCAEYTGEGDYIYGSVSNSYSLAGVKTPLLSKAELNDGYFEVILIKAPKNIGDMLDIIHAISREEYDDKHIVLFRTQAVSFSCKQNIPWTLDGELGGYFMNVGIQVLPKTFMIYTAK